MTQPSSTGHIRRSDIQILRGYAVLIVLVYHAGLKIFPGGFVGVDIFFVISGFLITSIIRRDLYNGSFSFSYFYARRAKRLFPAAFAIFFLTVIISPYLLTSTEFHDYGKQLTGALSFTANYVLKNQTGYFDGAADLKPLLHTWSLSVEEQFYFLIPVILFLMPPSWHSPFFLLLFISSLAGCFLAKANPETIFYTLPYRAWELALGALGAQYSKQIIDIKRKSKVAAKLSWIIIMMLPMLAITRDYPEIASFFSCMATVVILVARISLRKSWFSLGMLNIGNISYSIYLIHWPLFAYYNNLLIEPTPADPWIRVGLIIISLISGFFLYQFVEVPFLRREFTGRKILGFSVLGVSLLIGLIKWQDYMLVSSDLWIKIRSPSVGLDKFCTTAGPFNFMGCRNSASAQYVVWGDSMAMQLVNGIAASRDPAVPLIQATRHTCAPLLGISIYQKNAYSNYQLEESCINFNDEVINLLRAEKKRHTVIISGNYKAYLRAGQLLVYRSPIDGSLRHEESHIEDVFNALKETIDAIHEAGHRVIMVGPPPSASFDVSRCLERMLRSLVSIGGNTDCHIDQRVSDDVNLIFNDMTYRLMRSQDVHTLTFEPILCVDGRCRVTQNEIPLYRDKIHFSDAGSIAFIKEIGLIDWVDQMSR